MRLKKKNVFMCRFNNRESVDKLNILTNFKKRNIFRRLFPLLDWLDVVSYSIFYIVT